MIAPHRLLVLKITPFSVEMASASSLRSSVRLWTRQWKLTFSSVRA
jgi:hypothetical protein